MGIEAEVKIEINAGVTTNFLIGGLKVRAGTISLLSNVQTADTGKVRLGGLAPSLSTADTGKVRLGCRTPSLSTDYTGNVRLGCMAPSLTTVNKGKLRPAMSVAWLTTADTLEARSGRHAPRLI